MKKWLSRWMIGLAVAGAAVPLITMSSYSHAATGGAKVLTVDAPSGSASNPAPSAADQNAAPAKPGATASATPVTPAAAPMDGSASADALKQEAFAALRVGQFAQSSHLLARAAAIDSDPALTQMANWSTQFETQEAGFQAERHKQFEQAVADVHVLLDNHKEKYASGSLARAYLLSDDKDAFTHEKWVDDLIQQTIELAQNYEKSEQWLDLMGLYEQLSTLEPSNATWKDKLKLATRRVRLLALYAPDDLKAIQEADAKERDQVDALLVKSHEKDKLSKTKAPATQPEASTGPTTKGSGAGFTTDWHDALRGITMEMLREALPEARENYYRDVPLRTMEIGGLEGLRAVLTTQGLQKTFPALADNEKKSAMLKELDDLEALAKNADDDTEQGVMRSALKSLQSTNADTINLPENVLVNEFADGAFAQLDPFSDMIWPSDVEEFKKTTDGEFSGVGIQIQSGEDGSLKVVTPLEDSPAYRAGIQAGDVITRINGKNAKGINLNTAVRTITGPSGTSVVLTVRSPNGAHRDVTLIREKIKVASIKGWTHRAGGGWDYIIDPNQKIAYIRLTNFTKTTGDELTSALDDINKAGAKGVILDLRANPGGLLSAAIAVCDKFYSNGVIVKTHPDRPTPNASTVAMAHPEPDTCHLPLIVLVNQYSASASEIVSGALKDQHRALLVGERTFGKGSVQMLFPLSDGAAYMKLTTSHYYLPSGRCIHREENSTTWGVEPNVVVEVTPEQMRAVIDARQEMDILRNVNDPHTISGDINRLESQAPEQGNTAVGTSAAAPSTGPTTAPAVKDPLSLDAQLSAALMLMRMEVHGAQLMAAGM